MKRDMDLVRWILSEIEKQPSYNDEINLEREDYPSEVVFYHIMLLHEAGLIVARDESGINDLHWVPERLTWQGHEFLEAAKDDSRWNKAKEIMARGGGFVFEVAKPLLVQLLRDQIKDLLP